MQISEKIAAELGIRKGQADSAIRLIDEGNTIPFIARYRKEATGSLDDTQLRSLYDRLLALRALEERRAVICHTIEEQGAMNEALQAKLMAAETLAVLEDLYRPYRPKRKTRAGMAEARGLRPLADAILQQDVQGSVEALAAGFVTPADRLADTPEEQRVASAEEAVAGAMDILAERFSDDADVRAYARQAVRDVGTVVSAEKKEKKEKKDEPGAQPKKEGSVRRDVYEMYFAYSEAVKSIPGHRVLALDRGEREGVLTVSVEAPEEQILEFMRNRYILPCGSRDAVSLVAAAIEDSWSRLIAPSVERETRSALTEDAQEKAITVFRKNLEQLLLQPPVTGRTVLGWDPGYRTGCKIAVVDPTGKVLDTAVVYPTPPHSRIEETKKEISGLIEKHSVSLIALGNGTASRESEQVVADIIREMAPVRKVQYMIVNEAGASVYSASELAAKEFPQFDVGQRSAASMARRLQDPLAELVKIEPAALGVGQYQHDMNQKRLSEALAGVVEACVNRVGVDLNTASQPLLSYTAGISPALAKRIVERREQEGPFRSRKELLKVSGLGAKTFEQCAGFLRIRDGEEILDNTAVHPENYAAVSQLLQELGLSRSADDLQKAPAMVKDRNGTAARLGIGRPTLDDILSELARPGRDPREELQAPLLKEDVLTIEDLTPGMRLKGTVRNIVDFGAFVDIGVHQDGLVHISQLADRFVRDPMEVVHVGDVVDVTVLSVDPAKKRIALTMKKSGWRADMSDNTAGNAAGTDI